MPRKTVQSICTTPSEDAMILSSRKNDVVRQVEEVCRSWAESTTIPTLRSDGGLAARLVECRSAEEALAACNGWMIPQLDRLVATQHRLIELWCSSVACASAQRSCRNAAREQSRG